MGIFTELLANTDVAVEELDPHGVEGAIERLAPEELAGVTRARLQRQHEFAVGRLLAHRALARLGATAEPLRAGSDRAPLWPEGYTGSITHTRGWCAVAVARASAELGGVGIDIESDEPLAEKLWSIICTPRDRNWLLAHREAERGLLGKALFSAKESAYKAQYTLTRQFLDFSAMSIEIDLPAGRFRARMEVEVGTRFSPGDELLGRCARTPGLLGTTVLLPR